MSGYFKPLTPAFRAEIRNSIQRHKDELQTCQLNSLVNMQMESLNSLDWLISILPDGYPMPINADLTKRQGY